MFCEVQIGTYAPPELWSAVDIGHVVQMANAAMENTMARKALQAAPDPPLALDLVMENPEQHAKNEKMVAKTIQAWIPIASGGTWKLPLESHKPFGLDQFSYNADVA